jgi:hypothetical protein
MKTILVLTVTAMLVAVPADALAGKPAQKPSHGGKGQPKVQYILKGSLSAYTAASSGGNGTITILVKRSNRHGRALDGQSLTLPVSTSTRIVLHSGTTTIADNDNGIVKIRAPKHVAATDLVTTLQAAMARQVIDQGAAKTSS